MKTLTKTIKLSEGILILSGALIIVSVPLIFSFENFAVWTGAKILFGIGTVLYFFDL